MVNLCILKIGDVIEYILYCKKRVVISTSHLLSEFQVCEHITCMDSWLRIETHYSNHLFIKALYFPSASQASSLTFVMQRFRYTVKPFLNNGERKIRLDTLASFPWTSALMPRFKSDWSVLN